MFEKYDFDIIKKGEYDFSRFDNASVYSVPGSLSYQSPQRDFMYSGFR